MITKEQIQQMTADEVRDHEEQIHQQWWDVMDNKHTLEEIKIAREALIELDQTWYQPPPAKPQSDPSPAGAFACPADSQGRTPEIVSLSTLPIPIRNQKIRTRQDKVRIVLCVNNERRIPS